MKIWGIKTLSLNLALTLGCLNPKNLNPSVTTLTLTLTLTLTPIIVAMNLKWCWAFININKLAFTISQNCQ